jgi:L-histidine Nalpha-methyltransferase
MPPTGVGQSTSGVATHIHRMHTSDKTTVLSSLAREVRRGLTARPKVLPCRFFYDEEGSRIFEEICALPEYYVTRAEDEILARHAAEIVAGMPRVSELVELGSGSAKKTRRLIAALLAGSNEGAPRLRYVPIDISPSALSESARALSAEFPRLGIDPIECEYGEGLRALRRSRRGPRLVLWLGSNVGNFDRSEAARFLLEVRAALEPEDRLLIGIDRRKSKAILEPAYDDAAGVTARFNLNLLKRIDAELGGSFGLAAFRHVALYDEVEGRIEMHLESQRETVVRVEALDLAVHFARGERIHTENSYKYSDLEIEELARASSMRVEARWLDSRAYFASCLFAPV